MSETVKITREIAKVTIEMSQGCLRCVFRDENKEVCKYDRRLTTHGYNDFRNSLCRLNVEEVEEEVEIV
jgi:hypothetical protein